MASQDCSTHELAKSSVSNAEGEFTALKSLIREM
jgi:hypothetical protein